MRFFDNLAVAAVLAAMSTGAFAAEPKLITTESELKEALHHASEGDTILVGDIDFAYSPMGMTLSKGVTIKSGKNTPVVFSGGAFAVMGGAIYLSGAGNIFLDMKNCELSRNISGYGGAIWADQATVTLESCKISGNRFENFYSDTLTKGGGVGRTFLILSTLSGNRMYEQNLIYFDFMEKQI